MPPTLVFWGAPTLFLVGTPDPPAPETPTAEDLRRDMLAHAPSWLKEPETIIGAIFVAYAALFELYQQAVSTLNARSFIRRADASWLDEHGWERSKPRLPGETDEFYRQRIRTFEDAVTKPAILAAVNAVLLTGQATLTDHEDDNPLYVPPAGTTFFSLGVIGRGNAFSGSRAYTLAVPDQSLQARNTAFASETGQYNAASGSDRTFSWDQAEAGPAPNPGAYTADGGPLEAVDVYQRIVEILDALTAGGIEHRPIVV